MFPFIQCQCFDKRRGVYLVEKVSVFIKIRVHFWPEISALGVFFNFDNERMRPPKYPSAPPPPREVGLAGAELSPRMKIRNTETHTAARAIEYAFASISIGVIVDVFFIVD